ncbi:hypothetical protein MTO96_015716 [Rhipicephalus appendiculatus]
MNVPAATGARERRCGSCRWERCLGTCAWCPDGHRRFSRDTSTDLRRVYAIGAHKYAKAREWWFRAGVEVLSIFLFSMRNFSRSIFDITSALNQANRMHVNIVDNVDAFRAMGMQTCVCGDLERLPEELARQSGPL